MAKRQPLSFDSDELTKGLKESAGQGVNAFFSSPTSPQPQPEIKESAKPPIAVKQETKKSTKPKTNKQDKQDGNIASNITILQFTDEEIEELREPAYKAQTFRLTENETEWVKDTSYRLSKEIKRGKVSQADILRISFKLFDNFLALNKAELIKILERIK